MGRIAKVYIIFWPHFMYYFSGNWKLWIQRQSSAPIYNLGCKSLDQWALTSKLDVPIYGIEPNIKLFACSHTIKLTCRKSGYLLFLSKNTNRQLDSWCSIQGEEYRYFHRRRRLLIFLFHCQIVNMIWVAEM